MVVHYKDENDVLITKWYNEKKELIKFSRWFDSGRVEFTMTRKDNIIYLRRTK